MIMDQESRIKNQCANVIVNQKENRCILAHMLKTIYIGINGQNIKKWMHIYNRVS